MKSRYASDGQGRQVQPEGKTPRRVAMVIWKWKTRNSRRAAIPDVEKHVLHSLMFPAILSWIYQQPCAPSLFLKNSSECEGLDLPIFGPLFHEIGSDHHTEHVEHVLVSLVWTAPNGDPKHITQHSELVLYIKWHAVPPDFVLNFHTPGYLYVWCTVYHTRPWWPWESSFNPRPFPLLYSVWHHWLLSIDI